MIDYAAVRRNMVDAQLRTYDVNSKRVLDAVDRVARERFMPEGLRGLAYSDQATPWRFADGSERVMLPPMVVARMIQAAEIEPGERVLDVAGASGYAAAIMDGMGARVTLLETGAEMAAAARRALAAEGVVAVEVVDGPLAAGHSAGAPYDVILVEGGLSVEPTALFEQLGIGGRLVAVMGSGRAGRVVLHRRVGDAVGRRAVFDAAAPALREFQPPAGFVL